MNTEMMSEKTNPAVPISFADKDSLFKAYMSFTKGGGLFLPTTDPYKINDEIFLQVTLPAAEQPISVATTVVWINPSNATGKQGVGVEFKGREGDSLKSTIQSMLGANIGNPEPTFTM